MASKNKSQEKTRLHPRNKNRERYDLDTLLQIKPELADHLKPNNHGTNSIDFSNPIAIKILNTALLKQYYGIQYWEFPDNNLCPPIPGRADYIHHIADLLAESNSGVIPKGHTITCLDIGVGASCIYPIIGVIEYDWTFIGADIDANSIVAAQEIIANNSSLKNNISCRLQKEPKQIFEGILSAEDHIDITVCNPPFHASRAIAEQGTRRKIKNLSGKEEKTPTLNFAGISNELICEGGELAFIKRMIAQSATCSKNCYWFSTLVSKKEYLRELKKALKKVGIYQSKTIPMSTGNKSSRILVWSFLSEQEQLDWRANRWSEK